MALKYRSDIDGLRAVAVLPVILFHAGVGVFSGGFVGVDVFFVISGFLITQIIIDEIEKNEFSIVSFYERRARRILPALFVVMAVSLVGGWLWMLPNQLKDYSQSLVAVSLFASNVLFWKKDNYFSSAAEEKPLLHTWSLAVEEQFYLLFPLLILFLWRLGRDRVFIIVIAMAIISLMLSEWGGRHAPVANFYLAPTRMWELLAGSILAFLVNRKIEPNGALALLGLIGVCVSIFAFDESTPFPGLYAILPVAGTAFVIAFSGPGTVTYKILSSKGLVGVGLISYSAYLWHQPIFAFIRIKSLSSPSINLMLFMSLISIGLGYLSWRFVERPFRNKNKFSRRCVFLSSAVGLLLFMIIGLAGHFMDGYGFRFSPESREILRTNMSVFEDKISACWDRIESSPNIEGGCELGVTNAEPDFALIGDSHAGAVQNEISSVAKEYGLSGIGLSYRSCPPLTSVDPTDRQSTSALSCKALRNNLFSDEAIQSLPKYIVVLARWPLLIEKERYVNSDGYKESGSSWVWDIGSTSERGYSESMGDVIVTSLERYISAGKTLVIVYPVPEMGWSVPEYLAKAEHSKVGLSNESASESYDRFLERNKNAYSVLDSVGKGGGGINVYPEDVLCDKNVKSICHAFLNGHSLYYDDDHLSGYGAKLLSKEIVRIINENKQQFSKSAVQED